MFHFNLTYIAINFSIAVVVWSVVYFAMRRQSKKHLKEVMKNGSKK